MPAPIAAVARTASEPLLDMPPSASPGSSSAALAQFFAFGPGLRREENGGTLTRWVIQLASLRLLLGRRTNSFLGRVVVALSFRHSSCEGIHMIVGGIDHSRSGLWRNQPILDGALNRATFSGH